MRAGRSESWLKALQVGSQCTIDPIGLLKGASSSASRPRSGGKRRALKGGRPGGPGRVQCLRNGKSMRPNEKPRSYAAACQLRCMPHSAVDVRHLRAARRRLGPITVGARRVNE